MNGGRRNSRLPHRRADLVDAFNHIARGKETFHTGLLMFVCNDAALRVEPRPDGAGKR